MSVDCGEDQATITSTVENEFEADFRNILIAEMAVELTCTYQACTYGVEGAPYKTPALEIEYALKVLELHRTDSHGAGGGGHGGGLGNGVKIHMEKIPRPQLSGGSTQEDFRQFKIQWDQYVRASNETDDVMLRDQLLQCPDTDLRKAIHRALGIRVATINVADLLTEIETLAVI